MDLLPITWRNDKQHTTSMLISTIFSLKILSISALAAPIHITQTPEGRLTSKLLSDIPNIQRRGEVGGYGQALASAAASAAMKESARRRKEEADARQRLEAEHAKQKVPEAEQSLESEIVGHIVDGQHDEMEQIVPQAAVNLDERLVNMIPRPRDGSGVAVRVEDSGESAVTRLVANGENVFKDAEGLARDAGELADL